MPRQRGRASSDQSPRRQRIAGFLHGLAAAALAWAGADFLFSAERQRGLHLPSGTAGDILAFAITAAWLILLIAVVRRGLTAPRLPQTPPRRRGGDSGKARRPAAAPGRRAAASAGGYEPADEPDGA